MPTGAADSATIEVWGTYNPATATGSRIFDFSTVGGNAGFYQYLTPVSGVNNTQWKYDDGFGTEIGPIEAGITGDTGQEVLYTLVFDRNTTTTLGQGQFRMYRNGALVAVDDAENLTILSNLAGTTSNRLGHGQSVPGPGDGINPNGTPAAFLTGSINEFRTYNHAMTTNDVLFSAVAGPNVTSVEFTDKTWNAGTSDWNTGGNWTAAGVPGTVNRAVIGNGGTASVSGVVPVAGTIRVTNGTISVGAGGTLESQFPIELQPGATNTATVNVTGGGRLVVSGIINDAAAGVKTINIDNGTVAAGFSAALVNAGATTVIGAGGATFDSGSGQMSWSSVLSGNGNITKIGSGTLAIRAPTSGLGLADQAPNFFGEFFLNEGTVDVQLDHGVFGHGGSTQGGKVHLNNSKLVINTAFPAGGGFRKEFPADLEVIGDNLIENRVDRAATEIRLQGSLTGNGTLTFTKPNLGEPLGIDLENRPTGLVGDYNGDAKVNAPDYTAWRNRLGQAITLPNEDATITPAMVTPEDYDVWKANYGNSSAFGGMVDNSGFTGRFVVNGSWAVRFRAERSDLPHAIFVMNDAGAWAGKRGSDINPIVELGGVEGLAGSRLEASIAGGGDVLADLTYSIGGASQDAEFEGIVQDTSATDNVTVVKVGSNIQAFNGPNTYSGTTTINGGKLLVNGTHQMSATNLVPVGDYTVNSGGTLGGTGTIGSAGDNVDVIANGGTIAPGTSVGTLTVLGNATFGNNSHFAVEISGATADLLSVANLNLSSTSDFLDVSVLGAATPGNYTIAQYSGTLTGTFNNVTGGYTVSYATPGQVILTVPPGVGVGSVVPEPTTLVMSLLAALFVGGCRRRR
jgi:autotransporter-associated beta strand protein